MVEVSNELGSPCRRNAFGAEVTKTTAPFSTLELLF